MVCSWQVLACRGERHSAPLSHLGTAHHGGLVSLFVPAIIHRRGPVRSGGPAELGRQWLACAVLTLCGAVSPANGQSIYSWINPSGGLYVDPSNWEEQVTSLPGVPGPMDEAQFAQSGAAYLVQLTSDREAASHWISGDQVEYANGSYSLSLTGYN